MSKQSSVSERVPGPRRWHRRGGACWQALYSYTFRLDVSTFCGAWWLASLSFSPKNDSEFAIKCPLLACLAAAAAPTRRPGKGLHIFTSRLCEEFLSDALGGLGVYRDLKRIRLR